jgi:hypothetical protein
MLPWQITGLTNNSYFDGAHEVRHCARKHPDLGRIVLEVAKVYTKDGYRERLFRCAHYLLIRYPPTCKTVKDHCIDYTVMQKGI